MLYEVITQHAVNAIPDLEFIFKRFKMDITGLHLHGVENQAVDQPDNGRFGCHVNEMVHICVIFRRNFIDILVRFLDNGLDGLASGPVKPLYRFKNILCLPLTDFKVKISYNFV